MIRSLRVFIVSLTVLLPSYSFAVENLSLSELQRLGEKDLVLKRNLVPAEGESSSLRLSAMRDAAFASGAQHGYVYHIGTIKTKINKSATDLDKIFDFNTVMKLSSQGDTELYLLPPVMQEAKNVVAISDNNQKLRISGKVYTILTPAKLVGLPPNWRTYLLHDQEIDLQKPSHLLMPRNEEERGYWARWVSEGWVAGIKQAEFEMLYRVRRLGNEFNGMVKYMSLLAQGKVREPVVVSSKENVTGGGAQMRQEDIIYQVSLPATLDADEKNWEVLALDPRGGLTAPGEAENQ